VNIRLKTKCHCRHSESFENYQHFIRDHTHQRSNTKTEKFKFKNYFYYKGLIFDVSSHFIQARVIYYLGGEEPALIRIKELNP
jgi:hypothetical protein